MYYSVLKLCYIIGVLVATFSSIAVADYCERDKDNGWILIYENDKSGNTVCGEVQNLIKLVNQGYAIKTITPSNERTKKAILCKWAIVIDGHKSVLCMNTSDTTNININREYLTARGDLYGYCVYVGTDGMRHESWWPIGNNFSSEDFKVASSVQWYVKKLIKSGTPRQKNNL